MKVVVELTRDAAVLRAMDAIEQDGLTPAEAVDKLDLVPLLAPETREKLVRTGLIFEVQRELNRQRSTHTRKVAGEDDNEFIRAAREKLDPFETMYRNAAGKMVRLRDFVYADMERLDAEAAVHIANWTDFKVFTDAALKALAKDKGLRVGELPVQVQQRLRGLLGGPKR